MKQFDKLKHSMNNPKTKHKVYVALGCTAVGIIGSSFLATSGFVNVSFNPDKFSSVNHTGDNNVSFDGVVYSDKSNSDDDDSYSKDVSNNENQDGDSLQENKTSDSAIQSQNSDSTSTVIGDSITIGQITSGTTSTAQVDAISGGIGTGSSNSITPMISDSGIRIASDSTTGNGTLIDVGTGNSSNSNSTVNETHEQTPTNNNSFNTNTDPVDSSHPKPSDNTNSNPLINSNNIPDSNTGNNSGNNHNTGDNGGNSGGTGGTAGDNTNGGNGGGSGSSDGGGTNSGDSGYSNSNPSDSTDVAPPTNNNTPKGDGDNPDSGSGGGSSTNNNYNGNSKYMDVIGDFSNLCINQNIESIFSKNFARSIRLNFDSGYMILKDFQITANGLELTDLNTSKAVTDSKATAKFTYNSKKYSISFNYSVTQWKLGLYSFNNTLAVSGMTPNSDLKIDLKRYYTAFKNQNSLFCGWRTSDGDEIYTDECIMTSPNMSLYPVITMSPPDDNDVGEEYDISSSNTDIDFSKFGVYTKCKVLKIPKEVKFINTDGLAKAFPNLETIIVDNKNTVYSSFEGLLYKGDELISVPAALEEIKSYKDGITSIASNAFTNTKVVNIELPSTITTIKNNAFYNATGDILHINKECTLIGHKAFFSDTPETAIKEIVFDSLSVASYYDDSFDFGEFLPNIKVPDSSYDRAFQYYMSSWGYQIDKQYGDGTAITLIKTETGAEKRNTLIDGAVYSFFDSADKFTLTSVNYTISGDFVADDRTIAVAENAFYGCNEITSITFGKNVTKLEDNCLVGLKEVNSIVFKSTPPKIDSTFFDNTDLNINNLKIYTPADSFEEYIESWGIAIDKEYGEGTAEKIFEIDNDSYEVIDGAQYIRDDNGLILVRLLPQASLDFIPAEGTYKINDGAIDIDLNSIILPDTITEVCENAFEKSVGHIFVNSTADLDISKFGSGMIFVPDSKKEYYNGTPAIAISDKYILNSDRTITGTNILFYVPQDYNGVLSLSDDLISVYNNAAENCKDITELNIGASIEFIGNNAFYNCRKILKLNMDNAVSLAEIGNNAFYDCVLLNDITTPVNLAIIGDSAFEGCDNITNINTSNSIINSIGDKAFAGCNSLTGFNNRKTDENGVITEEYNTIDLSTLSDIKYLGKEAFSACPLVKSVKLSDLSELSEGLFSNCINLNEIKNWGKTEIIGSDAFKNTGLRYAYLTDSVKQVNSGAFANCTHLDTLLLGAQVQTLDTDFVEDNAKVILVFPDNTTDIDASNAQELIDKNKIYSKVYSTEANKDYCTEYFGTYTQPYDGSYFSSILNGGLYVNSKSINDSTSVSTLLKAGIKTDNFEMVDQSTISSFTNNLLEPDDLSCIVYIADDAFSECTALKTATINRTISSIPDHAFEGLSSLESVLFKTTSKHTPNYNIEIGEYAFKDCTSLKSCDLGNYISTVGRGIYEGCTSLTTLSWGTKSEEIPDDAFNGCSSLAIIMINTDSYNKLASVGERSFKDCTSLKNISGLNESLLFSSLNDIKDEAFENCSELETIYLPYSLTSLGNNVFNGCDNLQQIKVNSDPFDMGNYVFGPIPQKQFFDIGEADKTKVDSFITKWQPVLDSNYGTDAILNLLKYKAIEEKKEIDSDDNNNAEQENVVTTTDNPNKTPVDTDLNSEKPVATTNPTESTATEKPSSISNPTEIEEPSINTEDTRKDNVFKKPQSITDDESSKIAPVDIIDESEDLYSDDTLISDDSNDTSNESATSNKTSDSKSNTDTIKTDNSVTDNSVTDNSATDNSVTIESKSYDTDNFSNESNEIDTIEGD